MGRKSRPTATKKLMGEKNKNRINENEPKFTPGTDEPPYHLSGVAKREWERVCGELETAGVLTKVDRAALAAYCDAYSLWVKADNKLSKEGHVLIGEKGYQYPSPWMSIRNKSLEQMHKFLTEFGMTPASRTRISVTPPNPEVDPMEKVLQDAEKTAAKAFDGGR